VTLEGDRDVLGIWFQETEGAKFWLQVLTDLKQRGVQDILIACVDGLKGFPEAIEAVFPKAWVQTNSARASFRFARLIRSSAALRLAQAPVRTKHLPCLSLHGSDARRGASGVAAVNDPIRQQQADGDQPAAYPRESP